MAVSVNIARTAALDARDWGDKLPNERPDWMDPEWFIVACLRVEERLPFDRIAEQTGMTRGYAIRMWYRAIRAMYAHAEGTR